MPSEISPNLFCVRISSLTLKEFEERWENDSCVDNIQLGSTLEYTGDGDNCSHRCKGQIKGV